MSESVLKSKDTQQCRGLLTAVLCLGQIPVDPQSNDPSQSDKQDVLCMCFSPSEETLIASTSKSQLYSITMSLTEISKMSLAAALPASFLVTTGQIWIQFLSISPFTPS